LLLIFYFSLCFAFCFSFSSLIFPYISFWLYCSICREPSPIQKNLGDGLILCTGFYKNGFLLAPTCAHWVANELNKYFI